MVTFSRPLAYDTFLAMPRAGSTRWTAFEAIGSSEADELTWTCGGPVTQELGLRPCRSMGMRPQGVVAATGYLTDAAVKELEASPDVARVEGLQDSLTGLLYDVGGFGVERPGLTVNDRYWELVLND